MAQAVFHPRVNEVTATHPMLDSYYSQDLVFFSILVAVLASYTALAMTSRVSQSRGRAAALWLTGGAFAMGFGIWSMHFIGMLAFNLPIALGYDLTLTGLSLLAEVATRITALLGGSDTASRFGGDEFVLALAPGDVSQTTAFAERLLAALAQPYSWEHHSLHITASIGIAVYPQDGTSLHELTLNADAAMYYAKERGRNGYYFFDSAMNANAHQQFLLQQALRHALERGELALHYQPKYAARSGQVVGAEALLRWQHPIHGAISPARFLPLAEKTRLIIPIGNWVLDEACRQMSRWREAGHHDWSVAVNLSTIQLASPGLLEEVQAALSRHRLEARHLTLEITESTAMENAEESLAILNRLAELGLGISIDDFGTGYSSLLYLKRLPANELKIDRGFVATLTHEGDDATIIAAIIALGQALDMRIVAEGVETPEQRALLTELGCDTLQGYLLGRPMPGEQLLAHSHIDEPHRDPYAGGVLA